VEASGTIVTVIASREGRSQMDNDNERAMRRRIFTAEIDRLLDRAILTDACDIAEVLAHAVVEFLARADQPDIASTHFIDCLDEEFKSLPVPPASE